MQQDESITIILSKRSKAKSTVRSHLQTCQKQEKQTQGNSCQEGSYFCSVGSSYWERAHMKASALLMTFISGLEWLGSLCENSLSYILMIYRLCCVYYPLKISILKRFHIYKLYACEGKLCTSPVHFSDLPSLPLTHEKDILISVTLNRIHLCFNEFSWYTTAQDCQMFLQPLF